MSGSATWPAEKRYCGNIFDRQVIRVDIPICAATVEHDGVFVRVDVLLPDGDRWRVVESKAATKAKDCLSSIVRFSGSGARGHVGGTSIAKVLRVCTR